MMGSDIGRGGICGQILLVIVNIFFIVLGVIALAIGAWAIASGSTFGFVTGSQLIGGSALLIIIGGVVVIIATVGIAGAIFKWRPILLIYALVVLVCVILEIIGGILAFVYRDQVSNGIQNGIQRNLIGSYNATNPGAESNRVVDFFQSTFACCGFTNATDWVDLNLAAILANSRGHPPECLVCSIGQENCATFYYMDSIGGFNFTNNFNTTDVGCASVNTSALLALAIGAGVVGIIFGVLEIIGIIIALLLCCCIHRAREQTVV